MKCPRCGDPTRITDAQATSTGYRRTRRCDTCFKRFPTVEQIEDWNTEAHTLDLSRLSRAHRRAIQMIVAGARH